MGQEMTQNQLTEDTLVLMIGTQTICCAAGIRSTVTGLVGNTLNVDSLSWVRFDAGIGAGVDSFYEYLLKVRSPYSATVLSRLQSSCSLMSCADGHFCPT